MSDSEETHTVHPEALASFTVYGERTDDGKLVLGWGKINQTVDGWPESMEIGGDYHIYNLEYVEKEGYDEKFYSLDEVPDGAGLEQGVYM